MRTGRQERIRRLLTELGFITPGEQGWRKQAACAETDPEVFYPLNHQWGADPARSICSGCPVRELCLADAMASEDPASRWGVLGASRRPSGPSCSPGNDRRWPDEQADNARDHRRSDSGLKRTGPRTR